MKIFKKLKFLFYKVRKIRCNIVLFIFLYSIVNSVLFQGPLYHRAILSLETLDFGGSLSLATLFVFQMIVSMVILTTISLISVRLTKLVCILLTIGSAVALYFIVAYGTILDATMMGNVFNTNFSEVTGFAHPRLMIFLVFLGIIPAFVIKTITFTYVSRTKRVLFLFSTLLIGSSWIYANAKSWLWIDKNAKQFGGLILPWSYIVNSARYYNEITSSRQEQRLLPSLRFTDEKSVVVVLVIGESARAQDFSLYGYHRDTNPLLANAGVTVMPNTTSCATYTTRSLQCMLSHLGGGAPIGGGYEPLTSYLDRHGVEVIWRSNNFGEPPMKVSSFQKADEIRKECRDNCPREGYDEVLLYKIEERLENARNGKKILIVLHQSGSHGPQYFKKYPPEFEIFKPVCRTVDQQKCSSDELINTYDNTVLYTDFLLNQVIALLKPRENTASVMMYVSDHGESLGENGLYLHGIPYSIAPAVQTNIPFLVWMSDKFAERRNLANPLPVRNQNYSQDYVFHSVMGAFGLLSDVYKKDKDIFHPVAVP
ncbi:phosphoethanolamine--lipid A transferase EptA [Herbaspirillum aquaticum]|uniref:Phosphoethanolamine--lipid A transferase EptA n=1 Tax=Herbaspirillum aquaticum TaxID=568783 RepID=A0A225SL59_9BURK|nr:phosphoethanolamine--lipid A transferase EptA [Herbaspirillum aquaticum]OWY31700.1 phosphoethanolamine--lipid A transferase EptA [Herbaspirillum aquaticum]